MKRKKEVSLLIQRDGLQDNFVSSSEYIDSGENKESHRGRCKRLRDVVSSCCPS